MRPYFFHGLSSVELSDVCSPDVADIQCHGLKASAGNLRGKGGDIRSGQKTSNKRSARISGNRSARQALARDLSARINDMD